MPTAGTPCRSRCAHESACASRRQSHQDGIAELRLQWRERPDASRFHSNGAGVSVAQKWLRKQEDRNVPALNTLPQVRKWELRRSQERSCSPQSHGVSLRQQASALVDGPTVTHRTVEYYQTDGVSDQPAERSFGA
ncbi:MAG: hypothetical protein J07HQX50_00034 [Haloquadratum sp. J07HQX50]|nr:MAG: hypothetical protein J07HQX50_00034 [Haloquadratum sp. J07HQX50]